MMGVFLGSLGTCDTTALRYCSGAGFGAGLKEILKGENEELSLEITGGNFPELLARKKDYMRF